MTRIMAALWTLCLKRCPHIKIVSSLKIIIYQIQFSIAYMN